MSEIASSPAYEYQLEKVMAQTWELQGGKILVVEDASTASLVVVAKDLKSQEDKIAALEKVIESLRNESRA